MKTLVLFALTAFLASAALPVEAQSQRQATYGHQLAILHSGQLDLTDEQKQEIGEILADFRIEMRDRRVERRADTDRRGRAQRLEMREQSMERRAALVEQIRNVLQPEQQLRWDALAEEAAETRDEIRTYMVNAYISTVSDQVGLDEEKTEKVRAIVMEHHEKMAEMRGERGSENRRERMQQRTAFHEEIREILTEDEFTAWLQSWGELMPMGRDGMERREQRRDGRSNR